MDKTTEMWRKFHYIKQNSNFIDGKITSFVILVISKNFLESKLQRFELNFVFGAASVQTSMNIVPTLLFS